MKKNSGKALIIILCGLMLSQAVWSRGGFGGHGFGGWGYGRGFYGYGLGLGVGYGLGYGLYGPYGYGAYGNGYGGYYPPPVVTVPATPPVYVQQQVTAVAPSAPAANYWHYCRSPEGYYPYVKQCPGGWEMVSPHPTR